MYLGDGVVIGGVFAVKITFDKLTIYSFLVSQLLFGFSTAFWFLRLSLPNMTYRLLIKYNREILRNVYQIILEELLT